MKLTKSLWTKLITISLGATMAFGVGLTASKIANEVKAAEEIAYSTGFESSESFSAGTVYNNTTIKYGGPTGQQWGTYFGTASTTGPIAGSQSMQMRYYTATPSNHGYTFMNFDVANVTKVTFKALNTSGNNLKAEYSTNGGTSYVGAQTFTLGTSSGSFTYNVSATGEYASVRIKFTLVPGTVSGSRVTIDDVVVYKYISATTPVSSVSLNKSSSSLYVGDTEQLTATVLPADASDKTVSWGTSNANVVTVTSGGLVTAIGAGSATITVTTTDGGKTATCSYTITAVVLNSISIKTPATTTSFSLGQGFTSAGLVLNAVYNNGTIEVSSGYEISGVNTDVLGVQTATVTYGGKTTSYSIDVTNQGASIGAGTLASNLFISEYVEGASGTNKALEIFNGTGSSVDLSGYSLKLYTNGSVTVGSTLTMSGSLASGAVYVVAAATPTYSDILNNYDVYNGVVNFNGDDTITLWQGSTMIDIIGEIGKDGDNGTAFVGTPAGGDQTGTTVDRSLRRVSTITSPNAVFTWSEWNSYADTASDLSKHVYASADATAAEQATAFANYVMTGIGNNAAGNCVAVKSELDTEYGYMHADAKTIYTSSSDALFVNARNRMAYLASWVAAQGQGSGQSVIGDTDTSRSAFIAAAIIGIIGLSTVAGFYFIRKKKESF